MLHVWCYNPTLSVFNISCFLNSILTSISRHTCSCSFQERPPESSSESCVFKIIHRSCLYVRSKPFGLRTVTQCLITIITTQKAPTHTTLIPTVPTTPDSAQQENAYHCATGPYISTIARMRSRGQTWIPAVSTWWWIPWNATKLFPGAFPGTVDLFIFLSASRNDIGFVCWLLVIYMLPASLFTDESNEPVCLLNIT